MIQHGVVPLDLHRALPVRFLPEPWNGPLRRRVDDRLDALARAGHDLADLECQAAAAWLVAAVEDAL